MQVAANVTSGTVLNVKKSHYRPGQALEGSRKLKLPDLKTIGT
jgi:hypothetical protein